MKYDHIYRDFYEDELNAAIKNLKKYNKDVSNKCIDLAIDNRLNEAFNLSLCKSLIILKFKNFNDKNWMYEKCAKIFKNSDKRMSQNNFESETQLRSNYTDDDYDDDDDFITFQYESNTINFFYSIFSKYSRLIRTKYLYSDVKNRLPQELHDFQQKNNISTENIILFFQFLQEGFNINQNLTYKQYIDLFKIADFLQVKKFKIRLNQYFNHNNNDLDFQIQIILHEADNKYNTQNEEFNLSVQVEDLLTSKIDDCLLNEKFLKLPISLIFRIIEKSAKRQLNSDILYDFITKDIKSFFPLFYFLNVEFLSDERFDELFDFFNDQNGKFRQFFGYLPCSLTAIKKLKDEKKNLQSKVDELEQEKSRLQDNLNEIEIVKNRILQSLSETETEKNQVEQENSQLKERLTETETEKNQVEQENSQLKEKLTETETERSRIEQEKNQLQQRLVDIEEQKNELQIQLEEEKRSKIIGKIEARLKSDQFFNADINLFERGVELDTNNSWYIISSSNVESLGKEAYMSGEPITSLNQKTPDLSCRSGTYYVRAFVTDRNGKSAEFVSNSVTLSGGCLSFGYTGKSVCVVLARGRYKMEVWGAKGGDSTGSRRSSNPGSGGLGGYSVGTLSLQKETKIFVLVGGRGRPADSSDGAETAGSFPDGGGTKTGHNSSYTSVPGTGGGSTSIRLLSNSLYTRVIVAGGGGGAGGDYCNTDNGGFGGGSSGGNSYCCSSLRDQGAGTQTGSAPGPRGSGVAGVAGKFGLGATGLYMQNCDSGGGGGGGWYGGGSGGYGGPNYCASGGGGSGWVFTESSLSGWRLGDSSHASQFQLDNSFFLSDASTRPGNSSFPSPGGGNETGHNGDGFAKITPL